jgi:hypothetical protein
MRSWFRIERISLPTRQLVVYLRIKGRSLGNMKSRKNAEEMPKEEMPDRELRAVWLLQGFVAICKKNEHDRNATFRGLHSLFR